MTMLPSSLPMQRKRQQRRETGLLTRSKPLFSAATGYVWLNDRTRGNRMETVASLPMLRHIVVASSRLKQETAAGL